MKNTNNAPQLNDTNIRTPRKLIYWYCSNSLNPVLNGISDVWYNLFQNHHNLNEGSSYERILIEAMSNE